MYFPSKTYQPGDVLFNRGDVADTFYMIESGEVDLFVPPANTFLIRLKAGEAFGHQAIFSGGVRSATAVAVTELTCIEMTSESLQDMVQSQKTLIRPVLEALMLQLYMENAIQSTLPQLHPAPSA